MNRWEMQEPVRERVGEEVPSSMFRYDERQVWAIWEEEGVVFGDGR